MKRLGRLAALLMALTLTGCQPVVTGDMTNLMSAPKLTVEQQAIESALSASLKTKSQPKYQPKYPIEGDYRSSFILHDLNGDGINEAIALYCPSTDNAGTHVMILKKTGGKWRKAADFSESGNDVDKIEFGDFYGTGNDDLAIAWTQLSDTDLNLGIYSLKHDQYTSSSNFVQMKAVRMAGEKRSDILLLKQDKTTNQAVASMLGYSDGAFHELSSAPLDATVSRYAGIYLNDEVDGNANDILIDGYKGAHDMVTELLTYNDGKLSAPLLSKPKNIVTKTLRDVPIPCQDIAGDGAYDIPSAGELPGYQNTDYEKKLWLVSWNAVANGSISQQPVFSCVMNNTEGYYFIFPQNYIKNVTVDNSTGDSTWVFKTWDASAQKMKSSIFTIQTYTESAWKSLRTNDAVGSPVEIAANNGTVYAVVLSPKTADNSAYYLELSSIRRNFKLID